MVLESYTDALRTKVMVLTMQARSINEFLNNDLLSEESYIDHMAKSLDIIRQTVRILKQARENSIVHRERSTNNSRAGSINHSFAYSKLNETRMREDLNATMHSNISGVSIGRTPAGGVGLRNKLATDNNNILPPTSQKNIKTQPRTESSTPTSIIIQNNINKLNYLMPGNDKLKITSDRAIKKPSAKTDHTSSRLMNLLSISSPTDSKMKHSEPKHDLNSSLQDAGIKKKGFATRTHTIEPSLDFNIPPPVPNLGKTMSANEAARDNHPVVRGTSKDQIAHKIEEFKKEVKATLKEQIHANTNESILTNKVSSIDVRPEKHQNEHVGQLQSILSNMNQSVNKVIENRRGSPAPIDLKKKMLSSGGRTAPPTKDSPPKLSPSKVPVSDAKKNFREIMTMQAPESFSLNTIKPPRPNTHSLRSPK